MMVRKRFMIDEDQLREAEKYALATNRSFSELVKEALKQMMCRYPLQREKSHKTALESLQRRLDELEHRVELGYTRVHQGSTESYITDPP